jgi:hypothetical protein
LKRLLLDIPAVNYADPLSASALAASLDVCRTKLCDGCVTCRDEKKAAGHRETDWTCHPAFQLLLCGGRTARERTRDLEAAAVSPCSRACDE